MKNRIYLIIILISTLLLAQCRKDEIVTETDPAPIEVDAKNVAFLLHVTDVAGSPIEQATIKIPSSSQSLTSDENGVVLFELPFIPFEGERIIIEHPSYNTLTKMVTGVADSHNKVDVVLTKAVTKLISTGDTGSIGDGELTLPSALVSTDGSTYTGQVSVKYTYLDPDDRDFLDAAPGNLLALNTANQYRQLASLGMYSIELYDGQGGALAIPAGSTATVSFPIAEANAGAVPDEVPLWYFDEDRGLWIEDGKAIVDGDMMVAEVSHFTWWNCDLPYEFVPLCISFVDRLGNPVVGMKIKFAIDGVRYGTASTDDQGLIQSKTPLETIISISYELDGELVVGQEIGPFGEDAEKPVVVLDFDYVVVSGTAIDCNMNLVANGYGVAQIEGATVVFPLVDGVFSFNTSQVGEFELTLYDVSAGKSVTQSITITESTTDLALGTVAVCEQTIMSGISGVVMLDTDGDGQMDAPAVNYTLNIRGDAEIDVTTTETGTYEVFLPAGEYQMYMFSITGQTLYGVDNVGDGDEFDGQRCKIINCTVQADELDEGNDFFILPPTNAQITGIVLLDTDGDGIGDEPLEGVRVEFVVPAESFSFGSFTKEDGTFYTGLLNSVYDGYLSIDDASYALISDFDESPDPDGDDSAEGPNGRITVGLSYGEADADNNFVVKFASDATVSGSIFKDIDNDGVGDIPVVGAKVTLEALVTLLFITIESDADGNYEFSNVPEDLYYSISVDISGYTSVSDYDETPDPDGDDSSEGANNSIPVYVDEGENDLDNNFIVVKNDVGSISGHVLEDTDNDDVGDSPINGIELALLTSGGNILATTTADENGYYKFTDLEAGEYIIFEQDESELDADYVDVYDGDDSDDGDLEDGIINQDDMIAVTLQEGEDDEDNNFVEEQVGSIRGTVLLDTDGDGVGDTTHYFGEITLLDVNNGGESVINIMSDGTFGFFSVRPGDYVISTTDMMGTESVSDDDSTPEDVDDSNGVIDNRIKVTVEPGEDDLNNDFVDKNI